MEPGVFPSISVQSHAVHTHRVFLKERLCSSSVPPGALAVPLTSMASWAMSGMLDCGTSCTSPVISSAVLPCESGPCFLGFCTQTHNTASAKPPAPAWPHYWQLLQHSCCWTKGISESFRESVILFLICNMPCISCLWQNWNIFILNHHRPEKMEALRQYSLKWWLISNPLILIFFYSPLLPPPSPSESQNFMLPLIVLLWFCKVSYSFFLL